MELSEHIFSDDECLIQNYLWVRDPFKGKDTPMSIIIKKEENFIDGFTFHSVATGKR